MQNPAYRERGLQIYIEQTTGVERRFSMSLPMLLLFLLLRKRRTKLKFYLEL